MLGWHLAKVCSRIWNVYIDMYRQTNLLEGKTVYLKII